MLLYIDFLFHLPLELAGAILAYCAFSIFMSWRSGKLAETVQAGNPEAQTLLGSAFHVAGSAGDLLGSLATAFMIPVAFFLGKRLPRRRPARLTQAAGLTGM